MGLADSTLEPTRSVLFRSAASLAYRCGEYLESQKLIQCGLDGNPSVKVRTELFHLRELIAVKENESLFSQNAVVILTPLLRQKRKVNRRLLSSHTTRSTARSTNDNELSLCSQNKSYRVSLRKRKNASKANGEQNRSSRVKCFTVSIQGKPLLGKRTRIKKRRILG